MKDIFPESLGQKHGYTLYMGAYYTRQNMVAEPVFKPMQSGFEVHAVNHYSTLSLNTPPSLITD